VAISTYRVVFMRRQLCARGPALVAFMSERRECAHEAKSCCRVAQEDHATATRVLPAAHSKNTAICPPDRVDLPRCVRPGACHHALGRRRISTCGASIAVCAGAVGLGCSFVASVVVHCMRLAQNELAHLRWATQHDTQGKTSHDKTRKSTTSPPETRRDEARRDETRQDKTSQDKTREDKTRQDKTSQDKTREDKSRQDKTRYRYGVRARGCQAFTHGYLQIALVGKRNVRRASLWARPRTRRNKQLP
jgi:hypothetical protein